MMSPTRKTILAGVAALALGVGIAGVASAVGTDDDARPTGSQAERVKQAAVEAAGGGHVVGMERDGDAWEVKLVRHERGLEGLTDQAANRRLLVVHLSRDLQPSRIEAG